jgi:integrase
VPDRIDFLRRRLTVDRQLVTLASGRPVFGPPKSARSFRSVPLADVAVQAAHLGEHGRGQDGLVLHREDGKPISRPRFGGLWRLTRNRVEMPEAHDHDTRHTSPSCCSPAECRWRRLRTTWAAWATPPASC